MPSVKSKSPWEWMVCWRLWKFSPDHPEEPGCRCKNLTVNEHTIASNNDGSSASNYRSISSLHYPTLLACCFKNYLFPDSLLLMTCVLILISRFESCSKKRATVETIMMFFALKIIIKNVSIMLDHFASVQRSILVGACSSK